MLGLGHAIYCGVSVIGDESFAVILPDDLCHNEGDSVLIQMNAVSQNYPHCCVVAIEEVPKGEVGKYGVIEGELVLDSEDTYLVKNMVEKPNITEAPSNLAIIGRYILTKEIFDALRATSPDKNGEIQITDALNSLAAQGKVIAYKFKGKRYDCGSPKGLLKAVNEFSEF